MTLEKQIDPLTSAECLEILGHHTFGRLAFMDHVGVLPMILPVNYVLHADLVTFRTGPGSKLGTALRGEPGAFEVDGLNSADKTGWSVVVRGHAEVVTDSLELASLWETRLQPWAPGPSLTSFAFSPGEFPGAESASHKHPHSPTFGGASRTAHKPAALVSLARRGEYDASMATEALDRYPVDDPTAVAHVQQRAAGA